MKWSATIMYLYQSQTLAVLQFALTKNFKYLITSDDDFELLMNEISKLDDTGFYLGEFPLKIIHWA